MTDERYVTLAQRLHKRSREGKISWDEGQHEGVYRSAFGNLSIEVSSQPDDDYPEAPDYVVRILNSEGRLVDQFSNRDFRDMPEASDMYSLLQELYTSARRTAMGVERALHDLLEKLRDDDALPF